MHWAFYLRSLPVPQLVGFALTFGSAVHFVFTRVHGVSEGPVFIPLSTWLSSCPRAMCGKDFLLAT